MNTEKLRADFPVLEKKVKGMPLIYFDNACMTLKPKQVVEAMDDYYLNYPACAERSEHHLGKLATEKFEQSRRKIADFIGAKKHQELIFTKNSTEGINLIANSFDFSKFKKRGKSSVLLSEKEHNSNLLPWLRQKKLGLIDNIEFSKFNQDGFDLEDFTKKVKDTSLVSVVWTSNLDGSSSPVEQIIKISHENNVPVLLDGAQAVPHKEVNVKKLGADFLSFSGHKMLGPTGTGALYVKEEMMEKLNPFIVGGGTVIDSSFDGMQYEAGPQRFEAGLQNYAGVIGMAAACDYLKKVGMKDIEKHEMQLNKKATSLLNEMKSSISILGPKDAEKRSGILSFNIKGMDYHTIAIMLNESRNIMLRAGRHCVHSWFNAYNIDGSARASFYLYNTESEIDAFADELKKIVELTK